LIPTSGEILFATFLTRSIASVRTGFASFDGGGRCGADSGKAKRNGALMTFVVDPDIGRYFVRYTLDPLNSLRPLLRRAALVGGGESSGDAGSKGGQVNRHRIAALHPLVTIRYLFCYLFIRHPVFPPAAPRHAPRGAWCGARRLLHAH
jgi:hypothetical protein